MKIEIGESLTSSYLNHVVGCRIIQTNWKTSEKWIITENDKSRAKIFYEKIKSLEAFKTIFKESAFEQLLKQAEIDVLGINTEESTVYGIDVAFHGAGLNYGSKEETAQRILKKIFRTLFVMQAYFNHYEQFQSLFISPKTNPATLIIIEDLIDKANTLIDDEKINISFITNNDFYTQIVDPTLTASKNENDTSELFLRAVKLLGLDPRKTTNVPINQTMSSRNLNRGNSLNKRTKDGMKIGQYVQHTFREAYNQGLISNNEIFKLQDVDYSKNTFNSNYEILRAKTRTIQSSDGRNRYYAKEYFCGNYFLTSQWVESQWDFYLKWLKNIGFLNK